MSLSDRDRKILIVLGPLVVLLAYWFLLLSPKREEVATAKDELAQQVERRDTARQRVEALDGAKADFAEDYAELVRLGKAVPTEVDMPSLIVQLQAAARGTDIAFNKVSAGERVAAEPVAAPPAAPGEGDGSQPAAPGGEPAQSTPGEQTEGAGEDVSAANDANTTPPPAGEEGTAPPTGDPAAGATAAPGLETVPLTFEFTGDFFDLADFFHRLKRFVDVKREGVAVKGRLVTIDGFDFSSDTETFPKLKVEMRATAYLTPPAEGATAGASPAGPPPAAGEAPASAAPPPVPAAPPAATATPTPSP